MKKLLYLYYEIVRRFNSIIRIGRLVSLIDLSRHKKILLQEFDYSRIINISCYSSGTKIVALSTTCNITAKRSMDIEPNGVGRILPRKEIPVGDVSPSYTVTSSSRWQIKHPKCVADTGAFPEQKPRTDVSVVSGKQKI